MVMEQAMQSQIEGAQHTYASMSEDIHDLREALESLVEIIDKAGLSNLANGVQLWQTSWHVKASDRMEAARAALAKAGAT
jgi:hypothetical protein